MNIIEAKNIHLSYQKLDVLKGIDMNIQKGEFVSIVGASGAGKTTFLQVIGTLENPNKGTIKIKDTHMADLNDHELSLFRNKEIGFVFQFHNLLAEFTALENIYLPSLIAGRNKKSSEKKALEILSMLELEERAHHKPNQLSGGEQQRVAVARAMINSPSIMLADEPSGNLDSKNGEKLHEILIKLNKEFSQTIIVVTHNKDLANITDRKLEIKDGVII